MAYNRSPPNGYKPGSMPVGGGKPSNRIPAGGLPMFPGRDHRGVPTPQFPPRDRGIMQAFHRFMPAFPPQRERAQFLPTYQRLRNLPMDLARVRGPLPPPLYQMERVTMVPQSPYQRERGGSPYPRDNSPTPSFSRDREKSIHNAYRERGSSPYPRDTGYSRSKSPGLGRSRSPASSKRASNHGNHLQHQDNANEGYDGKGVNTEKCQLPTQRSPSPEKVPVTSDNDNAMETDDASEQANASSKDNETAADTSQKDVSNDQAAEDPSLEMSVPRLLGPGSSEPLAIESSIQPNTASVTHNYTDVPLPSTPPASYSLPVAMTDTALTGYKPAIKTGFAPGQAINSVIERLTSFATANMKTTIRVDPVAAREFLPLKKRIMSAFAMGQDTTSISSKQPVPSLGNHQSRSLHVYAEYGNSLPAIKATPHDKPRSHSSSRDSSSSRKRKSHSRSSSQPSEKKVRPSKPPKSDQPKAIVVTTPTRRTRSQTKTTPESKKEDRSKPKAEDATPVPQETDKQDKDKQDKDKHDKTKTIIMIISEKETPKLIISEKPSKEKEEKVPEKERSSKTSSVKSKSPDKDIKKGSRSRVKESKETKVKESKETKVKESKETKVKESKETKVKESKETKVKESMDIKMKESKDTISVSAESSSKENSSINKTITGENKPELDKSKDVKVDKQKDKSKSESSRSHEHGERDKKKSSSRDESKNRNSHSKSSRSSQSKSDKGKSASSKDMKESKDPKESNNLIDSKDPKNSKDVEKKSPVDSQREKRSSPAKYLEKSSPKNLQEQTKDACAKKESKSATSKSRSKSRSKVKESGEKVLMVKNTSIRLNRITCSGLPSTLASQLGLPSPSHESVGYSGALTPVVNSAQGIMTPLVLGDYKIRLPSDPQIMTTTIPIPSPLPLDLSLLRLAAPAGDQQLVPVRRSPRNKKGLLALPAPPPPPPLQAPPLSPLKLVKVKPLPPCSLPSDDMSDQPVTVPPQSNKGNKSRRRSKKTATVISSPVLKPEKLSPVLKPVAASPVLKKNSMSKSSPPKSASKGARHSSLSPQVDRLHEDVMDETSTENSKPLKPAVAGLSIDAKQDVATLEDMDGIMNDSANQAKDNDSKSLKSLKINICRLPYESIHGNHASASQIESLTCLASPPQAKDAKSDEMKSPTPKKIGARALASPPGRETTLFEDLLWQLQKGYFLRRGSDEGGAISIEEATSVAQAMSSTESPTPQSSAFTNRLHKAPHGVLNETFTSTPGEVAPSAVEQPIEGASVIETVSLGDTEKEVMPLDDKPEEIIPRKRKKASRKSGANKRKKTGPEAEEVQAEVSLLTEPQVSEKEAASGPTSQLPVKSSCGSAAMLSLDNQEDLSTSRRRSLRQKKKPEPNTSTNESEQPNDSIASSPHVSQPKKVAAQVESANVQQAKPPSSRRRGKKANSQVVESLDEKSESSRNLIALTKAQQPSVLRAMLLQPPLPFVKKQVVPPAQIENMMPETEAAPSKRPVRRCRTKRKLSVEPDELDNQEPPLTLNGAFGAPIKQTFNSSEVESVPAKRFFISQDERPVASPPQTPPQHPDSPVDAKTILKLKKLFGAPQRKGANLRDSLAVLNDAFTPPKAQKDVSVYDFDDDDDDVASSRQSKGKKDRSNSHNVLLKPPMQHFMGKSIPVPPKAKIRQRKKPPKEKSPPSVVLENNDDNSSRRKSSRPRKQINYNESGLVENSVVIHNSESKYSVKVESSSMSLKIKFRRQSEDQRPEEPTPMSPQHVSQAPSTEEDSFEKPRARRRRKSSGSKMIVTSETVSVTTNEVTEFVPRMAYLPSRTRTDSTDDEEEEDEEEDENSERSSHSSSDGEDDGGESPHCHHDGSDGHRGETGSEFSCDGCKDGSCTTITRRVRFRLVKIGQGMWKTVSIMEEPPQTMEMSPTHSPIQQMESEAVSSPLDAHNGSQSPPLAAEHSVSEDNDQLPAEVSPHSSPVAKCFMSPSKGTDYSQVASPKNEEPTLSMSPKSRHHSHNVCTPKRMDNLPPPSPATTRRYLCAAYGDHLPLPSQHTMERLALMSPDHLPIASPRKNAPMASPRTSEQFPIGLQKNVDNFAAPSPRGRDRMSMASPRVSEHVQVPSRGLDQLPMTSPRWPERHQPPSPRSMDRLLMPSPRSTEHLTMPSPRTERLHSATPKTSEPFTMPSHRNERVIMASPRRRDHVVMPSPRGFDRGPMASPKGKESFMMPSPRGSDRAAMFSPKGKEFITMPSPRSSERSASKKGNERLMMPSPRESDYLSSPRGREHLTIPSPRGSERLTMPSPRRTEPVIMSPPKRKEPHNRSSPRRSDRLPMTSPRTLDQVGMTSPRMNIPASHTPDTSPRGEEDGYSPSRLRSPPGPRYSPITSPVSNRSSRASFSSPRSPRCTAYDMRAGSQSEYMDTFDQSSPNHTAESPTHVQNISWSGESEGQSSPLRDAQSMEDYPHHPTLRSECNYEPGKYEYSDISDEDSDDEEPPPLSPIAPLCNLSLFTRTPMATPDHAGQIGGMFNREAENYSKPARLLRSRTSNKSVSEALGPQSQTQSAIFHGRTGASQTISQSENVSDSPISDISDTELSNPRQRGRKRDRRKNKGDGGSERSGRALRSKLSHSVSQLLNLSPRVGKVTNVSSDSSDASSEESDDDSSVEAPPVKSPKKLYTHSNVDISMPRLTRSQSGKHIGDTDSDIKGKATSVKNKAKDSGKKGEFKVPSPPKYAPQNVLEEAIQFDSEMSLSSSSTPSYPMVSPMSKTDAKGTPKANDILGNSDEMDLEDGFLDCTRTLSAEIEEQIKNQREKEQEQKKQQQPSPVVPPPQLEIPPPVGLQPDFQDLDFSCMVPSANGELYAPIIDPSEFISPANPTSTPQATSAPPAAPGVDSKSKSSQSSSKKKSSSRSSKAKKAGSETPMKPVDNAMDRLLSQESVGFGGLEDFDVTAAPILGPPASVEANLTGLDELFGTINTQDFAFTQNESIKDPVLECVDVIEETRVMVHKRGSSTPCRSAGGATPSTSRSGMAPGSERDANIGSAFLSSSMGLHTCGCGAVFADLWTFQQHQGFCYGSGGLYNYGF